MMTFHKYTPILCITQEHLRVLQTRGGLTPYLKPGGCSASLLNEMGQIQLRKTAGGQQRGLLLDPGGEIGVIGYGREAHRYLLEGLCHVSGG